MANCVLCGTAMERTGDYRFVSDAFRAAYTGDALYRCPACDLAQADMAAVDNARLTEYYRREYRDTGISGSHRTDIFLPRARALAALARRHHKGAIARVFEVGAGHGHNLMAFDDGTARLFTDEIDETVSLPPQLKPGTLADGDYDVVILSHVLEHFSDPVAVLNAVMDALKPGGVAVVEVPNDHPAQVERQPTHEPHLGFFTEATLGAALGKVGTVKALFSAGPMPVGQRPQTLREIGFKAYDKVRMKLGLPNDFASPRSRGRFVRAVVAKA